MTDTECISTLTPSHFLTRDVLSVPEELPSTSNHRDRWELLQNIKRGFWKKWSSDFLSSLKPRMKWQDAQSNEERGHSFNQRGGFSWHMANGSSSSSTSRQRRTSSSCNYENERLGFQMTCS
ncbi:hypothetical protein TNCV_4354721 [Trichonephila clavipes]|nr:hypothetical protein TNCV_4354721 [Trichonephila clavipes]